MKRIDLTMIMEYDDKDEQLVVDKIISEMAKKYRKSEILDYSLSITREYALLHTAPVADSPGGVMALVVKPMKRMTNKLQNGNSGLGGL